MGTLFEQPPRDFRTVTDDDVLDFLSRVDRISSDSGCPPSLVIKAIQCLEASRQNDLLASAGDVQDEQLAGVAKLIQDGIYSVENSVQRLESCARDTGRVLASRFN